MYDQPHEVCAADFARTLAAAEAAAARAEWNEAIELTAGLEPTTREERVALAFLRARAALHAELPAAALAALDALAGIGGRPDELATRDVLRGRALVALGRYADAVALLQRAAAADLRLVLWVRAELTAGEATPVPRSACARLLREKLAFGMLLLGEPETAWAIASAERGRTPAGVPAIAADLLGAQIASAAGETFTPVQLLTRAVTEAAQVAWDEAGLAGRRVLLTLTESAASAGLPDAAMLSCIYDELPALDSVTAGGQDARDLAPLEAMARAAVAGAGGRRDVQGPALRRAIAQWRALGDELGELRAVLALAGATYDPEALERAVTLTSLVPRSWLRRRYESLAELAHGPAHLSPAERRVMLAICQGLRGVSASTIPIPSRHTLQRARCGWTRASLGRREGGRRRARSSCHRSRKRVRKRTRPPHRDR